MQWSNAKNGGFSEAKPWFYVNQNYPEINVEAAERDPDSLLHFYRALLKFRKGNDVILHGRYREYEKQSRRLYVYTREYKGEGILVVCSFAEKPVEFRFPKKLAGRPMELLFSNYPAEAAKPDGFTTRPYEVRVYSYKTKG